MRVAVMGTGLLGGPIAERFKATGHQVVVYNRTRARAEPLRELGIQVALQPKEAVRAAECIVLVLADAAAIRSVLSADPVRKELAGRTVIQMGTIGPSESQTLKEEVCAIGGDYLEAPVLGSIAEAKAGTLQVMVGGSQEQFVRWADLFRSLSREPRLIGPVGKAAALKLALNQLIAAQIAAFALSLGFVQRQGIDVETFMAILRESALFAPTYDKKLPRLLHREYANPNFSTRHLLKDVELFLGEAKGCRLNTGNLDGIRSLLQKTVGLGLAEADYSAVYEAVNPAQGNGA
ncbi:MAG TPA: NAD(P)-dependent oxidoreductase [Nitrospiraceae bacterium]|jgi:3-hydroxyisobutyrate dehydrogenase|nr:NAD(P)-dependent oxidoreductase [Nitrospiraceae bacterium]